MTDYNTHALNQHQQDEDMKDEEQYYKEQCQHRAYKYFARQLAKINATNLEDHIFSLGGRESYCFVELMFDEVGAKNTKLDELFAKMLETEAGAEFKEEFALILGDKHYEIGEIDSD